MEFSLAWALLLYVVFSAAFLSLAAVNALHIVRFGSFDRRNIVMVSLYAIIILVVLGVSLAYFVTVDWNQTISLSLPSLSVPSLPGI
jgi:hypothetical protein